MYANWAPSLGGLEAVTEETKVRVEVGCIDQVIWRGRPGALGEAAAPTTMGVCAIVRIVFAEQQSSAELGREAGLCCGRRATR